VLESVRQLSHQTTNIIVPSTVQGKHTHNITKKTKEITEPLCHSLSTRKDLPKPAPIRSCLGACNGGFPSQPTLVRFLCEGVFFLCFFFSCARGERRVVLPFGLFRKRLKILLGPPKRKRVIEPRIVSRLSGAICPFANEYHLFIIGSRQTCNLVGYTTCTLHFFSAHTVINIKAIPKSKRALN
jgi:hypothetical protein